jgi:uncharacterized integral membrane protein
MPFCPKCGGSIEETMAFCPTCGTSLKSMPPTQEALGKEKQEPQMNNRPPEKEAEMEGEKHDYSYVGFLVSGLILIVIGAFAIIDLTSTLLSLSQVLEIMLIIIGAIIVCGSLYMVAPVRRYFGRLISRPKKQMAKV